MPEKDRGKLAAEKQGEKQGEKPDDEANWERDIEKRGYYYDDATGYEVYVPGEDEEEDGDGEADEKAKHS